MTSETQRTPDATTDRPDVDLALTVVRYADSADRCTIYPPGAAGDRRMATWLSADRAAFVDLDAAR